MALNKDFKVQILPDDNHGKRDELGYKYDSFKIFSYRPEKEVKEYCMKELRPSFRKEEMPHPHVFEFIEFTKTTNSNNEKFGNMYLYRVRKLGTH